MEPRTPAVDAEPSGARKRWQLVRRRAAHHGDRLRCGERAQHQPVPQVRLQTTQTAFVEALCAEEEVDAQRAPEPSDARQRLDEVRPRLEELTELVDGDEQRRSWGVPVVEAAELVQRPG